jgi:MFS transporter, DHA2 family, metal-tetracycline-proton antiporter
VSTITATGMKRVIPWIIYLMFFAILNETVFNVATPVISRQFALGPSGVSWMMTIFMVFFGIGSVIYGKLSDIHSLRRLIFVGVIVYVIGSLAGFVLRFSYPLVVAARAVQGIGASAIPALIFVIVARYFSDAERGRVFGFITSTVSVAIGIGPVIGGFVASRLHWSFLFLIPLLLLVALPFLARMLPREARKKGTVDILGAVLVAVMVGALVVFLNLGGWYFLAAFIAAHVLFVVRIRTAAHPFIEPSLFGNVKFRNGLVVGFCLFSIVIGVFFLVPLLLSDVYGMDSGGIGLLLFPGAISSVIFGPIGGGLADRKGSSSVVSIGLLLLMGGLILMFFLLSASVYVVAFAMLLTYVGFSLFQTAMVNSVSQTLPASDTGVGMGLFNLVGIISGALGTALVGKILDGRWLDFSLFRAASASRGSAYGNIMLVFAVVVVVGGVLYLRSYRGSARGTPAGEDAVE